MLNAVSFLLVSGLVVLFHELGHFAAAKAIGVKVDEFGLGLPPRLAVIGESDGTLYTLNAIPLGAFVHIPDDESSSYDKDSFRSKSLQARFAILAAGPLMNVFLALVLLTLAFNSGYPEPLDYALLVTGVASLSPAEKAGIKEGDVIVSIDGQDVESTEVLRRSTKEKLGQEVRLVVRRVEGLVELSVVPRGSGVEDQACIGVTITEIPLKVALKQESWGNAFRKGTEMVLETIAFTLAVPALVLARLMPLSAATPAGLPTIARALGQAAAQGMTGGWWFPILRLTGLLSASLAVTNLLPLPGLDGGRLLFLLLGFLRGKEMPLKREETIHRVGLAVLLGMAFIVAIHDLVHPSPLLSWLSFVERN